MVGRVQGVGYRYFAVAAARAAGIGGWVRNLRDGSVEVEAQGTRLAVGEFVARLGQGPRWSDVKHVQVSEVEPAEQRGAFKVIDVYAG